MSTRWIVIPKWGEFQHYSDRDPAWIKNYKSQLHDDDYLKLTLTQRGALHGIRLLYAASDEKLLGDTRALSRKLNGRITNETLKALNHAGFIRFSASKPLASRYQAASPEKRREEKKTRAKKMRKGAVLESAQKYVKEEAPFKSDKALRKRVGSEFGLVGDELESVMTLAAQVRSKTEGPTDADIPF